MSYKYEYTEITSPSQGYIDVYITNDGLPAIADISYDPAISTLRIWFDEELTTAQETTLEQIVTDSQNQSSTFVRTDGNEYREFYASNSGWTTYAARVKFTRPFVAVPTVRVLNMESSNASDLQLINIMPEYFDYTVRARGRQAISIQFDWEAWG